MNLTHLAEPHLPENDLAQQNDRILARRTGLAGAIARFEEWMADPDSPVRAIRRQPARAGEFAEFPGSAGAAVETSRWSRAASASSTRIRPRRSSTRRPGATWSS